MVNQDEDLLPKLEGSPREESAAIDTVGAVVRDRMRPDGRNVRYTTENGITFLCKPVPPYYIDAIVEAKPDPPVPIARVEREGMEPFEEPNPNDPEWLKACQAMEEERSLAVSRLMLGLGTEVVPPLPPGIFACDDDGWLDYIKIVEQLSGVPIPVKLGIPAERYISWLRYYALDNSNDLAVLGYLPRQISGLRGGEIAAAIAAFRDLGGRPAASGSEPVPSDEPSPPADQPNRAARRRRQ